MRIGIDARMYGPYQAGLGRYIEQLILNLGKYHRETKSDCEVVIFLRKENWDEYVPNNPKFKKVLANIPWYGWREQLQFPKIIKKEKIDLMHFPHWNIPLFYKGKFVVTIHDLIMFHFSRAQATTLGPIKFFIKNIAHHFLVKRIAKKAQTIIAPSEFTKQDIIKTLKINPQKIIVNYLGVTPISKQTNENENILEKLKINKPYILYVGSAYPHKNLNKLIDAWKIFQNKQNYNLVLVGKKNHFYNQLINQVSKEQIKNIIFTDYLSDQDLTAIYQNASLYVFPSLYEGFGLPPLEAMQYNLPVISSNTSCLPEILKSSALYFDPNDSGDISSAIWQGLNNQNLHQNLMESSQKLIHNYSWQKNAKTTWEIYQNSV